MSFSSICFVIFVDLESLIYCSQKASPKISCNIVLNLTLSLTQNDHVIWNRVRRCRSNQVIHLSDRLDIDETREPDVHENLFSPIPFPHTFNLHVIRKWRSQAFGSPETRLDDQRQETTIKRQQEIKKRVSSILRKLLLVWNFFL